MAPELRAAVKAVVWISNVRLSMVQPSRPSRVLPVYAALLAN